uniref:Uncharacterized protein n=1 Tax=Meloidogyne hapla TaxID=6305 RepID=A0A1I8BCG6_MELHA
MSPTNYSEKGFQTPFNLPADFVNLNLGNDESYGVSGSNARRSFAGIKGTRGQPTTRRKKVDMPESSSRNRNENFVGEGLQPGMSSGQVKKTLARNNSMPVNLKRNDDEEDSGQNMGQAPNPYSFPEQQQTWPQPGLNDFQRNIGPYYTHTLGPYYSIQGYYGNQQGFHDDYQPQLSHSDELLRQTDSFFSPDPSYPPNHEFVQQAPQASNNPTGSGTNDTPYVIVKPDGSTTTVTNTVNYPEGYDPNNSFVPPPATRPNKFWNGLYYQEY